MMRVCFGLVFLCICAPVWGGNFSRQIKKAAAYLNQRGAQLGFEAVFSLELLQRNYDILVDTTAAKARLLNKPPAKLRPFLRVLNRDAIMPELDISVVRGWRGVIARAVHCDLYPLPWDFFQNVRKLSSRNDYEAPAGILALGITTWMNCDVDQHTLANEKLVQVQKIPDLLDRSEVGSLFWLECVLALFHAEKQEWVKQEYCRKLAELQLENGSWKNNDNLTAKALSLLVMVEAAANPVKRQRPLKFLPDATPSPS